MWCTVQGGEVVQSPWLGLSLFVSLRWAFLFIPSWFSGGSVKNPSADAGDECLTPGSGRAPGEGNGNPPQCSCLGNPMDREAWQATVPGVEKELDMTQQLNNNKKGWLGFGKTPVSEALVNSFL